jgi:hypothetical protein
MLKKILAAVLKMAKEYMNDFIKSWLKNKLKKVVWIVGAIFFVVLLLIIFL